ncbi:MAG: MFS transporter, partial [Thermofilaceae archaeon]
MKYMKSEARKVFSLFIVSSSLASLSHSLWYTLFPLYLERRGFQLWEIGFASSLATTLSFILALPAGFIADIASLRSSLVLAAIAQTITLHLLKDASTSLLVVSIAAYTFFATLRGQVSLRLLSMLGSRGWALKYSAFLFFSSLASVIGPYFSGLIVQQTGFDELFTISETVLLASTPIAAMVNFHESRQERTSRLKVVWRTAHSQELLLLTFSLALHDFSVFGVMSYTTLFPLNVLKLTPYEIGSLASLGSAVSLASQLLAGYFTDRIGAKAALAFHYVGVSAGYALMGLSRDFKSLATAVIVQNIAFPFDMPARRKILTFLA